MVIGAVVAFVGAVCAFALVRQRDFVVPDRAVAARPARRRRGGEARRRDRHDGDAPARSATAVRVLPCLSRSRSRARFVRLEPLSEAHIPALVEAAAEDRSNYQWAYTPDGPGQMTDYVRDAAGEGGLGRPRGLRHGAQGRRPGEARPGRRCDPLLRDRLLAVAARAPPTSAHGVPDVVDIGFTWLAGSAQRTPVNTEAKLLMMTHAFEVWEVHRVALQTDVRNKRSWAAIERIGGQLDGIMRADRPGADDTVRTSARFSIVAEEWPEVKERLTGAARRRA